jgi:hypothetical protein
MKTKIDFTPGPWWYDGREIMTVPRGDIKICRIHPVTQKDDGSANARLIAAAPDLLEFLEELLDDHKNHCFMIDFQERAEKIIAKAKGL